MKLPEEETIPTQHEQDDDNKAERQTRTDIEPIGSWDLYPRTFSSECPSHGAVRPHRFPQTMAPLTASKRRKAEEQWGYRANSSEASLQTLASL
jgi:hypothetical protein